MRIFAAAGCWQNIQILDAASQAALGGKTALKGWYKALEDLVWLTQLGLNMAGAQNFWVFCKERLDRSKKEKNHRVGFNSHQ